MAFFQIAATSWSGYDADAMKHMDWENDVDVLQPDTQKWKMMSCEGQKRDSVF